MRLCDLLGIFLMQTLMAVSFSDLGGIVIESKKKKILVLLIHGAHRSSAVLDVSWACPRTGGGLIASGVGCSYRLG